MHRLEADLHARFKDGPDILLFVQQGVTDGMWFWDLENPEDEWYSPELVRLLGYEPDEVPHKASWWQEQIFEEDLGPALANFDRHLADPSHAFDQTCRYRHQSGRTIWVRCRGLIIRDHEGTPVRMLGTHQDITELKEAYARLELLTLTDELTGAANRRGIEKTLQDWFSYARDEGRSLYAGIIDLDDFKEYNTRLGYAGGDRLLKMIARRLNNATRTGESTYGRIGGDEFCALFLVDERDQAIVALHKLTTALHEPFPLAGRVTFSAALARVRQPLLASVLENADVALLGAKTNGKAHNAMVPTLPPPDR